MLVTGRWAIHLLFALRSLECPQVLLKARIVLYNVRHYTLSNAIHACEYNSIGIYLPVQQTSPGSEPSRLIVA